MELIRKGSSKDILRVLSSGEIDMRISRRFSAFDRGPMPGRFTKSDIYRHAISVRVFQVLAYHGFDTHYKSHNNQAKTIRVEPFDVYVYGERHENSRGNVVPLEIIDRRVITEKMLDRAKTDKVLWQKMFDRLGGQPMQVGTRLCRPLVEFTTKFEDADRYLSDEEAISVGGLGECSLAQLYALIERASDCISDFFRSCGFDRIDGKWEVAITRDGPSFVIIDSYSPDEMRLIGLDDGLQYDKDFLRKEIERLHPEWVAKLKAAKEAYPSDKSKWPRYPRNFLPPEFIIIFVGRYKVVAQRIGAI